MTDTVRSLAALQSLLADNTGGAISPQDVRDFLITALDVPHAKSYRLANMTFGATNVAYPVEFDTNETLDYIVHSTLTNPSRFQVTYAGTYIITASFILDLTAGTNQQIDLWLRVNGNDLANSARTYHIVNASAEMAAVFSTVITLQAGDYIEVLAHVDSTNIRLLAAAAVVGTPNIPAIPAAVMTMTRMSVHA